MPLYFLRVSFWVMLITFCAAIASLSFFGVFRYANVIKVTKEAIFTTKYATLFADGTLVLTADPITAAKETASHIHLNACNFDYAYTLLFQTTYSQHLNNSGWSIGITPSGGVTYTGLTPNNSMAAYFSELAREVQCHV